MFNTLRIVTCTIALAFFAALAPLASAYDPVINAGTINWVKAAQTGRADMFIIGDSMVWHGGTGWDGGMIAGASNTIGLAGTGLIDGQVRYGSGEGEGYEACTYTPTSHGWSDNIADAPANRQNYVARGEVLTATSPNANEYGIRVFSPPFGGNTLDQNAAYDWHLWTASQTGGGSLTPIRRNNMRVMQQELPPVATQTPAQGLQHIVAGFDPLDPQDIRPTEFILKDVNDTAVFYQRVVQPNATGITVTSWSYSAETMRSFYLDKWTDPTWDQEGRKSYLSAMIEGGSGKLNVMIAEGLNDRWEGHSTPSLGNGLLPGNSPEAFADNVQFMIEAVRADWTAAGKNLDDLSFTLLGMYEDGFEAGMGYPIRDFAQKLQALALADSQVSFIDIGEFCLSYSDAVQAGYMHDQIHLSREGALVYSQQVMDILTVPEPTTLTLITLPALALFRHRISHNK